MGLKEGTTERGSNKTIVSSWSGRRSCVGKGNWTDPRLGRGGRPGREGRLRNGGGVQVGRSKWVSGLWTTGTVWSGGMRQVCVRLRLDTHSETVRRDPEGRRQY